VQAAGRAAVHMAGLKEEHHTQVVDAGFVEVE